MIFEKQMEKIYKNMMFTRCDDTETVFYFSASDFIGLKEEKYIFKSSMGHDLVGYIYNYDNPINNRIVIFDYGFGGGHKAYMKEIEMLCKYGYMVFAYDHTGCMESGGENPNGLAQSLCDLNDCVTTIKNDARFNLFDINVVGHSWGAFSTLNIAKLHPEISHIVAMSGFVSVEEMIKTFFAGPLKLFRKTILELEKKSNPVYFEFNAIDSLSNTNTKALLIYSSDDHLCKKNHFDMLKAGLSSNENISFMLVDNKAHNPNYTIDAVKLLNDFVKAKTKFLKGKNITREDRIQFSKSFDWDKMTTQDENIWQEIFNHLNN